MKTTTWKVRSAGRRNGRIVTLNPSFLSALAAESYVRNLEAKYGDWYAYEVFSPDTLRSQDGPSRPTVTPGRAQTAPEAPEAQDDTETRWRPSEAQLRAFEAESRELDRKSWAKFADRDLKARATPQDTDEVNTEGVCLRCSGTGSFITYVENGVPKGPGGACYRCQGRGVQTLHDVRRNEFRDRHQRVY